MTTPSNELDLTKLKMLCEKATPGPWKRDDVYRNGKWSIVCPHESHSSWRVLLTFNANFDPQADNDFIAATDPQTVLALITAYKKARAALVEISKCTSTGSDYSVPSYEASTAIHTLSDLSTLIKEEK
jgi:hypothetical protein